MIKEEFISECKKINVQISDEIYNKLKLYMDLLIEWNKKYIIVADYNNKSFKIIDTDNNSIYNIDTEHKKALCCVKKINHPKYGESLLTAAIDQTIKIWGIE